MVELPDEHVRNVCRLGAGVACCRYLTGRQGWHCAKLTDLRQTIDDRVERLMFGARGDNCEGME